MKTKTGRSHYTCTFKAWNDEEIVCEENDFRIVAIDGRKTMEKYVNRFERHGIHACYTGLRNLDEEGELK